MGSIEKAGEGRAGSGEKNRPGRAAFDKPIDREPGTGYT